MPKTKRTAKSKRKLVVMNPRAAGIDVGSRIHVVAVGSERAEESVRTFQTFTDDLYALGEWLRAMGATSVAMESTSVYWIPVFEVLEKLGYEVMLVNAREAKSVPGRKTDVNDAQWIQQLHQYGLLRASFRPPQAIAALCAYMRHRDRLLDYSAAHTQPVPRHKTRQSNEPKFDVRAALYALLGVDLTQINGIGPSVALKLVAECGTNLSSWPTAKHFTSWLTLAPGNKIFGGRILSARTRRTCNRITSLLRLAAVNVDKTDTALGEFYRRLSARIGKAKAVTATARKIAVLFYNTLRFGMAYQDPGADYYEQRYRQRAVKHRRRRAATLGFALHEAQPEGVP